MPGYATKHFDMDAVEQVGLVKMDILAQGNLHPIPGIHPIVTQGASRVATVTIEPMAVAAMCAAVAATAMPRPRAAEIGAAAPTLRARSPPCGSIARSHWRIAN